MSSFVSFPIEAYRNFAAGAFTGFAPAAKDFTIENARALMWFTQLSYEYGRKEDDKIRLVKDLWGIKEIRPFEAKEDHRYDTHGLLGIRDDAVLLAFCGTDPFVFDTVLTDARFPFTGDNVHHGFAEAAAAPEVTAALAAAIAATRPPNGPPRPLLIAGHSLGAAIAALVALQAARDPSSPPLTGVYTYGMPRTGGATFKQRYEEAINGQLGLTTYRLVNGPDIVPTVPPSFLRYCHVGRLIRCETDGLFVATELLATTASDEPHFEPGVLDIVKGLVSILRLASPSGPNALGILFKALPASLRDHLQDQYLKALGFNIKF